ncbi:hypothetical protein AMS68_005058 [Peltaster fructicola]|uniref:PH domain-containing protein n=1 Tax=Peltaster fructicola TaxID=286661 RepID=A0A6H0XXZ9_9PEZI|nr:hypothetical protein AMS68_005058 [Peltaster fructicola]
MSRDSNDSTSGSWSKRKTFFNISSLGSNGHTDSSDKPTMLKKHRKRPSLLTDLKDVDSAYAAGEIRSAPPASENTKQRPPLSIRGHSKRPTSVFTSLRGSIRSNTDKDDASLEPLSAASTTAPSLTFGETLTDTTSSSRTVRIHGEVQTSAGMFRKKKEYLVLTENTLTRYKSQAKAAETFSSIPHSLSRSSTIKHGQMPSYGSSGDLQTVSDSSGEKTGRIALQQVVAVHTPDDGKPYFTIEVSYLDEDSGQAAAITLQFGNPQERDTWLQSIRAAVIDARMRDTQHISSYNLENAARIIERDNDYDPDNCVIYKIVQRHSSVKSRSSSDDLTKVASTVGLLAIGVHKIHLMPVARSVNRTSSPSLGSAAPVSSSYGILTMSSLRVSDSDDSFELTLRRPLQRPRTLYLASSSSHEIATRLYYAENFLRPEGGHRFYKLTAPSEVEEMLPPSVATDVEEHNCFQRTLIAYCVSHGVNPTNIRYSVNYDCDDAPRFDLLPAADERRA